MIDIHSHLIPNVDDGSKSVEDTFKMFNEARSVGFSDVILTPHYLTEYYTPDTKELVFWKDRLQEALVKNNKNLKIHSGMEVYISEEIGELIKDNKILTLANSRYMLIELPMSTKIKYLDHIIYLLESMGFKFILAHPERYKEVQENPNLVEEYIEKGCLIQCNYGSIVGQYGKEAKKVIKYLLKKDLVHFMGTDCHRKGSVYLEVPKAIKKIERVVGKQKVYEITTWNARKILDNEQW